MQRSGINLTFTVAMVTKMTGLMGWKKETDRFGANLTEKLT